MAIADRAVSALAAPVEVSGTWVRVGASIGLAMRHDGIDSDSLMSEADVAMYSAKRQGKNRVVDHRALPPAASAECTTSVELNRYWYEEPDPLP